VAETTHCIVGYAACGHPEFVYTDDDDHLEVEPFSIARWAAVTLRLHGIVACLRVGGSVKLVPLAEAREIRLSGCSCPESGRSRRG